MANSGLQSEVGSSTSVSLLRRAKAHDPEAWRRLSNLYGPLVYQWCRHVGLQPADAADVVQETFCSVAAALARFRHDEPGDSFRAWLWTITRNKLRDFHRRRAGKPEAVGGEEAYGQMQQLPAAAPEEADDDARRAVRADLAERALALMQGDFEETTWRAFWLTAVENTTAPQAAEEIGISVAAVYMAKSRVLRRLREELDGLDLIE